MSNRKGFIFVDRAIVDHWINQKDPEFRVWINLLLKAQHSEQETPVIIGKQERYLKQGEMIFAIDNFAERLNITKHQLKRVLDLFKKSKMIEKLKQDDGKFYKQGKGIPYACMVVNYEHWQSYYDPKAISSQLHRNQKTLYGNKVNKGNNFNKDNNQFYQNDVIHFKCPNCDYKVVEEHGNYGLYHLCPTCDQQVVRTDVLST